jgi:pimeloyl-ACP methyl ester carboxylesterase
VVIPITAKDMLAAWNPSVRHHVIADAGHGLTYTHIAAVLAAIFEL